MRVEYCFEGLVDEVVNICLLQLCGSLISLPYVSCLRRTVSEVPGCGEDDEVHGFGYQVR